MKIGFLGLGKMGMPMAMRLIAAEVVAAAEDDTRRSLLTVESAVRTMSKLPGKRILILVSPGFPNLQPELLRFQSQVLDEAARAGVVPSASTDELGLLHPSGFSNQPHDVQQRTWLEVRSRPGCVRDRSGRGHRGSR